MRKTDLAWLAGFLEGEGSFFGYTHKSRVKGRVYKYRIAGMHVGSVDVDTMKRVSKLLGVNLNGPYRNSGFGSKPIYQCSLQRQPAAKWMLRLMPWMGQRRKKQIRQALLYMEA